MKRQSWLALSLAVVLSLGGAVPLAAAVSAGGGSDPIYVTFFFHNEDDHYWQHVLREEQEYHTYRADLIAKVKLLQQHRVVVNWESDHVVLTAMQKYEKGDLLRATNGKNILRWMVEDMGMKVDPHGHLHQYNYADLAYLIESLGVKPTAVVGGFELFRCGPDPAKVEQVNWRRNLEINADGTIRGRKFPHYTWRPLILGQPAMRGHLFDEFSSGVWRPQETGDYLTHQANGKFIAIGTGYPFLSDPLPPGPRRLSYSSIDYIKELAEKLRTGQAPAGKIYTCSIFLVDSPQALSVEALRRALTALQDLARRGRIVYRDYDSVVKIWQTRYQSRPNRFGIENFSIYPKLKARLEEFCRQPPPGPRPPGPPPGPGRLPLRPERPGPPF